jgi:hypothetical protein
LIYLARSEYLKIRTADSEINRLIGFLSELIACRFERNFIFMSCVMNGGWYGKRGRIHSNQQVESVHLLCASGLAPATHLNFFLLCWQFTNKDIAAQHNPEVREDKEDFMQHRIQLLPMYNVWQQEIFLDHLGPIWWDVMY